MMLPLGVSHPSSSHLAQNAPFHDGAVQIVKQCNILDLMARFVVLHARNKRQLEPSESQLIFPDFFPV